jgi:hypothetical protein
MKRLTKRLALAGQLAISILVFGSAQADVVIRAPEARAVFQRDRAGEAEFEVRGLVEATALETLEIRAVRVDELAGEATEWEAVPNASIGVEFVHALRLVGGRYRIEARAREGAGVTTETFVDKIGVGEVFITAGQSNSANSGRPALTPEEDRVSAWGPEGWQHARDPQPIATGGGGTPWPVLGDLLVREQGVPVGFISVGWGGTRVDQWLPGGTLYPRL